MDRLTLLDRLGELGLIELLRARKRWAFVADDGFHAHLLSALPAEDHGRIHRLVDVASLTPAHLEGFEVAVICTNGSEELPREAINRRLGIRPLRLFADLMLRRAAGAPLRGPIPSDQDPPPDFSYAILCLPRCGSTLLVKEFEMLRLGQPREHFRTPIATLLAQREVSGFNLERWWAFLRAAATVDGVFGTKIIFDFLAMASEHMTPRERDWLTGKLREMPVVRILRTNKIDQAVSDYVARKTGVWHLWDDGIKAGYGERLAAVSADMKELVALYRKFVRNEERLEQLLQENGIRPIDIDYVALARTPKAAVAAAVEKLGRPVPPDYLASPVSLEPTRTAIHERLSAELAAAIA